MADVNSRHESLFGDLPGASVPKGVCPACTKDLEPNGWCFECRRYPDVTEPIGMIDAIARLRTLGLTESEIGEAFARTGAGGEEPLAVVQEILARRAA